MESRALDRRGPRNLRKESRQLRQNSLEKGRTLPEYLDQAQVEGLIRCAPTAQAALIMLVQWRAGLRISEAIALDVADLTLDADRPTLRVRWGKGRRARIVPIHPELRAAFTNLLTYGGVKKGRLIKVSRSTASRWIKEKALPKAIESGVIPYGRPVTTHTLRHSAARHWLAHGIQINVVSRWLGHASLQTTLIYLEILPDPTGEIERVP